MYSLENYKDYIQDWTSSLEQPGQNNFEHPQRNFMSTK